MSHYCVETHELVGVENACQLHRPLLRGTLVARELHQLAVESERTLQAFDEKIVNNDPRAAISTVKNALAMWQCLFIARKQRRCCLLCMLNERDRCGLSLIEYAEVFKSYACKQSLQMFADAAAAECPSQCPDQNTFTCPVCLELLWQPLVSTTCEHRYCRTCLFQVCTDKSRASDAAVYCPVCRGIWTTPLGYTVDPLTVYAMQKYVPEKYAQICVEVDAVRTSGVSSSERFDAARVSIDTALEFVNELTVHLRERPMLDRNGKITFNFDDALLGAESPRIVTLCVDKWAPRVAGDAAASSQLSSGYFIEWSTPLLISTSSSKQRFVLSYLIARYVSSIAMRFSGQFSYAPTIEGGGGEAATQGIYTSRLMIAHHTTLDILRAISTAFLQQVSIVSSALQILLMCSAQVCDHNVSSVQHMCRQAERWMAQRVLGTGIDLPHHDDCRWTLIVQHVRCKLSDEMPRCHSPWPSACNELQMSQLIEQIAQANSMQCTRHIGRFGVPLFTNHWYTLDRRFILEYDCVHSQLLVLSILEQSSVGDGDLLKFFQTRNHHYYFDTGDAATHSNHVDEHGVLHPALLYSFPTHQLNVPSLLKRIGEIIGVCTSSSSSSTVERV